MVIRHAVSIDERRAKFRQDLMYQRRPKNRHHNHPHVGEFIDQIRQSMDGPAASSSAQPQNGTSNGHTGSAADPGKLLSPNDAVMAPSTSDRGRSRNLNQHRRSKSRSRFAPYRSHLRRRSPCRSEQGDAASAGGDDRSEAADDMGKEQDDQDIDEVWFAGGHGDVGGGWMVLDSEKSASHVPLMWIVREAMKAGLHFDLEKVELMGCLGDPSRSQNKPDIRVQSESQVEGTEISVPDEKPTTNGNVDECRDHLHAGAHTYRIHDSLAFGGGMSRLAVAAWNFMEYLPFRRMDLRDDGSWKPIRWPLPRGEVRDVPSGVRVHGSVIRRLKADESYRPGNLIIGGGGRGVRRAPEKYGAGDWVCVAEPGDVVGEIWMRRKDAEEHDVKVVG